VTPRHLNKHIDYDTCCAPVPNDENARSVAFPVDMAITADGRTLYVASLGTSEVAVYDTAALEDDTFVPDVATQIPLSGGGPTGLALDEDRARLYVLTRFDHAIKIIDTTSHLEVGRAAMFNPEPTNLVAGRRSCTTRAFPRHTETRRAQAVTSSATRTTSRGILATLMARQRPIPIRSAPGRVPSSRSTSSTP
jgi:DNA-binding beta-propeller fold protein YncE